MEATASTTHALNRPTKTTISTTKRCQNTHFRFLNLTFSRTLLNRKNKTTRLHLTQCSTKPNTDKENTTDESSIINPIPNIILQTQAKPNPIEPISSNPSFSRGLIFDLGAKDSWDSLEIGSPVVKRYLGDEEERWQMWYHGKSSQNPDSDSIGLAVSSNGIHWERGTQTVRSNADVGQVMKISEDWWAFDTHGVRPSEVAVMSSDKVRVNSAVYWMYYTGFNAEEIGPFDNYPKFCVDNVSTGKIYKSLPGLAMSQDGRHWARIEGEHHSGALLDVGLEGEWDSSFISSPNVVFHKSGDLRMYYHSFDLKNGHFAVGMARSRDGIRWVKLGKIMGGGAHGSFDERGIINPRVLRDRRDNKYVMVYEGVGLDGKRSIGLAVSLDGLKDWTRFRDYPLLEKSLDCEWDCEGMGYPCLVQMDNETEGWRLYYRGVGKEGRSGIGLAVSKGSELSSFERWTGFHL